MADLRREYRVGVYVFSLDRIARHVEERAAEEWAYDLQNHIPISRGLAQRIDDWGIPFPTVIPNPYPPTLRPPIEPARYISSIPTIAVNPGMPCYPRRPVRILQHPLQPQFLRCESLKLCAPTHIPLHFNSNQQFCHTFMLQFAPNTPGYHSPPLQPTTSKQ